MRERVFSSADAARRFAPLFSTPTRRSKPSVGSEMRPGNVFFCRPGAPPCRHGAPSPCGVRSRPPGAPTERGGYNGLRTAAICPKAKGAPALLLVATALRRRVAPDHAPPGAPTERGGYKGLRTAAVYPKAKGAPSLSLSPRRSVAVWRQITRPPAPRRSGAATTASGPRRFTRRRGAPRGMSPCSHGAPSPCGARSRAPPGAPTERGGAKGLRPTIILSYPHARGILPGSWIPPATRRRCRSTSSWGKSSKPPGHPPAPAAR